MAERDPGFESPCSREGRSPEPEAQPAPPWVPASAGTRPRPHPAWLGLARLLAPVPAYLRYAIASALALGVDLGLFLALLHGHAPPTSASAAGYSAGILAHWLVSSRFVFADGLAVTGAARQRQKALFVLTAFVGLILTVAIIAAGQIVGIDPRLAKLVAIVVSFQSGWLMRRRVVFA